MQHELAAAKPGFHFPCVLRVVSLRSLHCLTGIILAHCGRLPGIVGKAKAERPALGTALGLQPDVHKRIFSPTSSQNARPSAKDLGVLSVIDSITMPAPRPE